MAAVAPAGSAPVIQDGWLQSCCCVTQKPRDEIAQWMLLDTNAHASPSCMQMLLCQCRSEERVPSGIESVPQLAGLAGATLQRAPPDWPTKGSVQTLKWCRYDKEKRVADLQVDHWNLSRRRMSFLSSLRTLVRALAWQGIFPRSRTWLLHA